MTYEIHGCMIEMGDGMQTAKARRLEIRDADGKVIQSAAEAEFKTKVEGEGDSAVSIGAQEQAHQWARSLPAIVEGEKASKRAQKKNGK